MATPHDPRAGRAVVYTDFLSLLKVGADWVVVSKCWAATGLDSPFAGCGYTDTTPLAAAHGEIAEQLLYYFIGGATEPSAATLQQVFEPSTLLQGATPAGAHVQLPGEDFLAQVAAHAGEPVDTAGHRFNKVGKTNVLLPRKTTTI